MAENWIELERGATYEVIGGVSFLGKTGKAVEIRSGGFGRMWAEIEYAPGEKEWFRASHLKLSETRAGKVPREKSGAGRYARTRSAIDDTFSEGLE